jgi:hypothetical protein
MAERHADPLFSAAYDGELDPGARRRFDAHLEGCARCAGAFDDYRTALDAVRMLPVVAMPATVRLPLGAPRAAPGRAALLGRLRDALLHPQPATAAATLAAVGVAAVVLAVHHGGGSAPATTAGSGAVAQSGGGSGGYSLRAPVPLLAPIAPVPCPVAPVAAGAAAPAAFAHAARTAAADGGELVLATPAGSYAPGESVPIYARLTTAPGAPGAAIAVVPCVTLETEGSAAASAPRAVAPAPQDDAARAPAHDSAAQPTPLAVATSGPAPYSAAGSSASDRGAQASGPLLSVTIPPGIPRGTVLRLVALIPPHFAGNPGDIPIQVALLITVR